eukprot:scaffold215254_cov48-Prasinocladus_malaysianus.AAC.1
MSCNTELTGIPQHAYQALLLWLLGIHSDDNEVKCKRVQKGAGFENDRQKPQAWLCQAVSAYVCISRACSAPEGCRILWCCRWTASPGPAADRLAPRKTQHENPQSGQKENPLPA